MPGYFTWGTTATNGGGGALAALATAAPERAADGCAVAAGARDYLLGRNPFGASFVVGYGPQAPRGTRTTGPRCSAPACPSAPSSAARRRATRSTGQGFEAARPAQQPLRHLRGPSARDYVTSEPALDYAADSILLLAALAGRCS